MSEDTGKSGKGFVRGWLESFIVNRPLLIRLVGRIVRPDEIEDILQETFLHSYAASRKQQIYNPRAFMLKTARHIALNHVNRAESRLNCSINDLEVIDNELPGASHSVEDEYQSEEKFLIFCKAVARLPVSCRRAFILHKVYGLSQKEVSTYLKISSSTVEKHIAKGMLMTAQYILSQGYVVGAGKGSAEKYKVKGKANEE